MTTNDLAHTSKSNPLLKIIEDLDNGKIKSLEIHHIRGIYEENGVTSERFEKILISHPIFLSKATIAVDSNNVQDIQKSLKQWHQEDRGGINVRMRLRFMGESNECYHVIYIGNFDYALSINGKRWGWNKSFFKYCEKLSRKHGKMLEE